MTSKITEEKIFSYIDLSDPTEKIGIEKLRQNKNIRGFTGVRLKALAETLSFTRGWSYQESLNRIRNGLEKLKSNL